MVVVQLTGRVERRKEYKEGNYSLTLLTDCWAGWGSAVVMHWDSLVFKLARLGLSLRVLSEDDFLSLSCSLLCGLSFLRKSNRGTASPLAQRLEKSSLSYSKNKMGRSARPQ